MSLSGVPLTQPSDPCAIADAGRLRRPGRVPAVPGADRQPPAESAATARALAAVARLGGHVRRQPAQRVTAAARRTSAAAGGGRPSAGGGGRRAPLLPHLGAARLQDAAHHRGGAGARVVPL